MNYIHFLGTVAHRLETALKKIHLIAAGLTLTLSAASGAEPTWESSLKLIEALLHDLHFCASVGLLVQALLLVARYLLGKATKAIHDSRNHDQ